VFEMWIDPEERPTGETGVDAAFQPRHRLVCLSEYRVRTGDLVIDMMRVAEGPWRAECYGMLPRARTYRPRQCCP
jgi:hypothetical protein